MGRHRTGSARRFSTAVAAPPVRCGVPIYALGEQVPDIDPDAYVHPDAVIIGSVTIGADSSIWPGAVLRGDDGEIRIGARTSVQDNCVLHTTPDDPTVVGDDCVIGHIVHLEGCTIEYRALVGNGSIVLHRVGRPHRCDRRRQRGRARRHRGAGRRARRGLAGGDQAGPGARSR